MVLVVVLSSAMGQASPVAKKLHFVVSTMPQCQLCSTLKRRPFQVDAVCSARCSRWRQRALHHTHSTRETLEIVVIMPAHTTDVLYMLLFDLHGTRELIMECLPVADRVNLALAVGRDCRYQPFDDSKPFFNDHEALVHLKCPRLVKLARAKLFELCAGTCELEVGSFIVTRHSMSNVGDNPLRYVHGADLHSWIVMTFAIRPTVARLAPHGTISPDPNIPEVTWSGDPDEVNRAIESVNTFVTKTICDQSADVTTDHHVIERSRNYFRRSAYVPSTAQYVEKLSGLPRMRVSTQFTIRGSPRSSPTTGASPQTTPAIYRAFDYSCSEDLCNQGVSPNSRYFNRHKHNSAVSPIDCVDTVYASDILDTSRPTVKVRVVSA